MESIVVCVQKTLKTKEQPDLLCARVSVTCSKCLEQCFHFGPSYLKGDASCYSSAHGLGLAPIWRYMK